MVSGNRPCNDTTQEYKVSFSSGYFSLKTETVIHIRSFKLTYWVPINSLNRRQNSFLVYWKRNHWMFIISLGKHVACLLKGFVFLQHLDVAELHRDFPSQASKTINEALFLWSLVWKEYNMQIFFLESTSTINLSTVIKRQVCNSF